MKVILTKDVPAVGKQGDVATVAEGYARNFLFPRKLAIEASKGNVFNLERQHQIEERLKEKRVSSAQAIADKISGKAIAIKAKAGSASKLFGSVTSQDIADAIKAQTGADIDKRKIDLPKPIRTVGSYTIPVRLHRDVATNIQVEIEADTE